MNKRIVLALSIIIFLGYIVIGCGTKGKIKGTVTDGSGEVVPDTIVTATPGDYQSVTDKNGKYLIEDLIAGEYVVTASSNGLSGTGTATIDFSGFSCGEVECNIVVSTGSNISTKIIVTASLVSIPANGTSTSLVTAMICDDSNLLVTTATNQVTFSVSGPGTLLVTTVKSASSGIATVMMQSTTTSGTATVTATATGLTQGTVITTTVSLPERVLIPAGNFNMGSTSGGSEEQPVHTVYLDAYYIDKYEVTNGAYKMFIDAGGYNNSAYWTTDGWGWRTNFGFTEPYYWTDSTFGYNATNGPNLPVVGVCWYEAYAYANWAGKRLPTEAEWEKAARGTDERPYPWGEGIDSSKLNYNNNIGQTAVVGSYETGKSPYGCYDMAGNVCEWCNDWYDGSYYSSSPTNNPQGPATSSYLRVLRGGAWDSDNSSSVRSADRVNNGPGDRGYWSFNTGFRCAAGVVP